jgi:HPt (histidine-containing phosphotransfer) domain-containing protein
MSNLIDIEKLLNQFGGDREVLRMIVGTFVDTYPDAISDIKKSLESQNSLDLQEAAHRFKGSVSNFMADSTVQKAFTLENMGRNNDLSGGQEALDELIKEVDELVKELKSI